MINVVDLSFQYAGHCDWALKNINLDIRHGECVILAGPSGCGKSTLAKCLNGLIPHFEKGVRAGRVLLDGKDLAERPMYCIAQRVGAVFQNPRSQFFTTRVADEVAFGCENTGLSRQCLLRRIDDALDRFHIAHLRQRTVFHLSAGERQKAILAAVYAMGADVWVLDEPSANLDPSAVAALETVMGNLKREGKTLIIAEHRCHYLKRLADQIVILDEGRVADIQTGKRFFKKSNAEMNRRGLRWIHVPAGFSSITDTLPAHRRNGRLAAQDLCFRYPDDADDALRRVSLSCAEGEIIALAGANGAGKTTLSMLLCGLFRARSGRICINGKARRTKARLRLCRMVLQEADHQLFTESAFRELELALTDSRHDPARITGLLDAVGLAAKTHCRPQSLSAGEKQRLAVAAALIAEPAVLILDEPTSGLDAVSMRRMGTLLQKAARHGGVVLVATHDVEFMQTCCTRVLQMEKGGIANGQTA